jgi:diguanylate cyclase (GGDEF)-like protein
MEGSQKNSVLIVDDEQSNLILLNKILSPDYTVYAAKSGTEALERVAKDAPDLILLDILMPDLNGFEVLAQLKNAPETRDIPVIVISGLTGEEDEERGFFQGAVDYITKPFKAAIVRARVHTHMRILQHIRIIEQLGLTDPLTNIANRRGFDERMTREWRRAIREKLPISFLMMDVDKFKVYNDTYGHPQGDVLLQSVAKIFAEAARRSCDMAARLGGEEFGVLIPSTDLEGALLIAEQIRAAVEALRIPTADGVITTVTISVGVVSRIPEEGSAIKDFLKQADENLYTAKTTGRNRVCSGE